MPEISLSVIEEDVFVTDPICRTDPHCSKAPACCLFEGYPPTQTVEEEVQLGADVRIRRAALMFEKRNITSMKDMGPCCELAEDGTCAIYPKRPKVCGCFRPNHWECWYYREQAGYPKKPKAIL